MSQACGHHQSNQSHPTYVFDLPDNHRSNQSDPTDDVDLSDQPDPSDDDDPSDPPDPTDGLPSALRQALPAATLRY